MTVWSWLCAAAAVVSAISAGATLTGRRIPFIERPTLPASTSLANAAGLGCWAVSTSSAVSGQAAGVWGMVGTVCVAGALAIEYLVRRQKRDVR